MNTDQANLEVNDIRRVIALLRDAFPCAYFERTKHDLICHIHIQSDDEGEVTPHRIIIAAQMVGGKGDAAFSLKSVTLTWEQSSGNETLERGWGSMDTIVVTTMSDAIGWVSWVRGQLTGADKVAALPGRAVMPHLTALCWHYPITTLGKNLTALPLGKQGVSGAFSKLKLTVAVYQPPKGGIYTIRLLRPGETYIDKAWALFWQGPSEQPLLTVPPSLTTEIEQAAYDLRREMDDASTETTGPTEALNRMVVRMSQRPLPEKVIAGPMLLKWVRERLGDILNERNSKLPPGFVKVVSTLGYEEGTLAEGPVYVECQGVRELVANVNTSSL